MSIGNNYILNFCPTGMIPTTAMTPHVPITPREIVQDVIDSPVPLSMVHIHARDDDGNPTWDKDVYAHIIEGIRSHNEDIVICVSTSGRDWPEFWKRAEVLDLDGDLKPDMASLALSSLNFNKTAGVNVPDTIQGLALKMLDKGIKPELEVFDLGMLNYAHYLANKAMVIQPFYFNFILGNVACAQANPLSLGAILAHLPSNCVWAVGGVGDYQLSANVLGLASGGGVRIGLEDNIWMTPEREELATNHALLCRINAIAGAMGLSPLPPKKLRQRLGL